MHKTLSYFFILMLSLAAASCSSKKNAAADSGVTSPKRGGVAAMITPEINTLAETYHPWSTFYAPFNMRLSNPVSFNISGRATMVHNQAVQLSMRMLGMEVAVAYIDSDSAKIIDKFHKYIVSVPFSAIASTTNLTIGDLQSALLGQAFYPGSGTISAGTADTQFSVSHKNDNLILTPRRIPAGAKWYMTVEPGPELRSITVQPNGMEAFLLTYAEITSTIAGSVASTVDLAGSLKSKELKASVYWNLEKAKWDDGRTIDIPEYSSYKRLSFNDLLEVLKKF